VVYSETGLASGVVLSRRDKTYIDISLAWEPNPLNGDITTLKDTRAINASIKNIIMTYPLEMPFAPNFGSEVTTLMFDPVDLATAGILTLEIENAILANEPRVEIENVIVEPYDEQYMFEVSVEYKIVGSEQIYIVSEILTPTR
jgi:phage baseplate assembly protein W